MAKILLLEKGRSLRFILGLMSYFFLAPTGWGQTEPDGTKLVSAPGITIITDKDDYAPLSNAIFSGSGFEPFEVVILRVKNLTQPCETTYADQSYAPWTVTTDADGTFTTNWTVCNCPGDSLRLKVTGQTTGKVGYAYFTDSQPNNLTLTPNSRNILQGASTTYSAQVVMAGNSNLCNITLLVTNLPAGATATVSSPNPTSANSTFTRTITINTTSVISPGTYNFEVKAQGDSTCQGNRNNDPTATGTLIVTAPSCTQPIIADINDITTSTTSGKCSAIVNYSVSSSGTPPNYTFTFSGATTGNGNGTGSGETFNIGVTTVEITATNSCGSDTESFDITVEDTTAPVITLTGDNPQVLESCGSYTELGATYDDCETGLSIVIDASAVDMTTPGNYTVTYNLTDTAGNVAEQVTRTVTVEDTTAPVITLTGDNPQVLESCGSYTELGASYDDCETGLSIVIDASAVDMTTPGNYTVTYNLTDTAGNVAEQVTRTVTVEDTTAPVITLTGDNPQVLESCGSYTELGASYDDCETGLSIVIDASAVDMTTPGNYTVTYNLTDTAGNVAEQVTRTVTVEDTTAPVITLTGDNPQVLESCGSYTELGATYDDCETGLSIVIDASAVDMTTPGNYTVTYNLTDTAGNIAEQVTRTVTVEDTTAPVITLTGDNLQVLESCGSYTELGATYNDCETGLSIVIDASDVDMNAPGNYTVTYNLTDTAGNVAEQVTRTVTVEDTTAPVITLTGDNPQVLESCGSYTELGASYDDCETGLSIVIDASAVDMTTPGNYTVTYNLTDTAGNVAEQVTRTVTVEDTTAPVITLTGDNPQVLESCGSYTELGASYDDCETGLSIVIDASAVDMTTPGNYTVTYNLTDTAGNVAEQVTRTVTVEDTTAPVITLTGDNPQVLESCGSYTELGASYDDCETGLSIVIDASDVDMDNPGEYQVTYNLTDTAGNIAEQVTRTVTVQDTTAPVVDAKSSVTVTLDNTGAGSLAVANVLNSVSTDACGIASEVLSRTSFGCGDVGTFDITLTVKDVNDNPTVATISVTVEDNVAPEITCVDDQTRANDPNTCSYTAVGNEFDPTFSDNCSGATVTNNYNNASILAGATFEEGKTEVTWTVTDAAGNTTTCTFTVTVANEDPVINSITGPIDPVQVNTGVKLTANYEDNNVVSANWKLITNGAVAYENEGVIGTEEGTITGSFNPEPGVYIVELEVTDACGITATLRYEYIVIFDPTGGFVTGGGWIESPVGAMEGDKYGVTGRANFGFNAKYKTGKNNLTEVDGHTNFQFKAGDLHFSSFEHEDMSLVIAGKKATYTGYGTVNGSGVHRFRVIAIDGQANGGIGPDQFRIKIWGDGSNSDADVLYDNHRGVAESSDLATTLGGGSIVIHKPKSGGKMAETTEKLSSQSVDQPLVLDILGNLAVAPNPVKTDAAVRFSLIEDANVTLRIFDFQGREVNRLYQGAVKANEVKEVNFQRNNLMSGSYIVKLTTDRGHSYDKQIIVE